MKKVFTYMLFVILGIAVGLGISVTVYYVTGHTLFANLLGTRAKHETPSLSVGANNAELTGYAYEILGYIKEGDYDALSQVVHPEYGVIFSPYATINLVSNKRFTASQVKGFPEDKNQYVWGIYDGIGDPINLTPSEYFKEFVFDKDYTLAPELGIDLVVMTGNSLENIKVELPDARFVDFHIPGDKENGGLDWSSLRLGFEEYEGELKLTVILHSEWTI
jgi:hypothetical protein